jgi:hypothetical protein
VVAKYYFPYFPKVDLVILYQIFNIIIIIVTDAKDGLINSAVILTKDDSKLR